MNMISWSAAILAGGRGRRLGGADKSALVIGTRSILDRQIALLRPLTPHLLIVTNDRSRVQASGVRVVEDRIAGAGALGGVYTALEEASTDHVLIIGCDMPFLTGPFLKYLIEQAGNADVVVPRDARGRHPLCALYARHISPGLYARIHAGDLRVGAALEDVAVCDLGPDMLAPFDPDGRLLLNVNTPEDYARAVSMANDEQSHARASDLPTG
jgi:molybdopterin-guanine dinucleotide biosynthesis protein A